MPEKYEELQLSTLCGLFGDYANACNRANEFGHEIAFANGCYWANAFEFQIPRAVLIAEIQRMEDWIVAHREIVDAARTLAIENGDLME